MTERLTWVDTVKCVCMLSVYLLHTITYSGADTTLGLSLLPFYINAFFFVSGYLLFKSAERPLVEKMRNIVWRLIVPTILFSAIFYVPKNLFHATQITPIHFVRVVFGGATYWFTSALVVAQLFFALLFRFRFSRHTSIVLGVSCVLFFLLTPGMGIAPEGLTNFPWYWRTGLAYTFIMSLGVAYQRYEARVDAWLRMGGAVVAFILYIVLLCYVWADGYLCYIGGPGYCAPAEILLTLVSLLWLIPLVKRLPCRKITTWMGTNSLPFYFLSGVMPAMLCTIGKRIVAVDNVAMIIIITLLSLVFSSAATYAIRRWMPWSIGLKR